MPRRTPLLLVAVALALAGCATGFDRGALYTRLQDESFQVTEDEIKQIQAIRPQLLFPCRVAVYLKGDSNSWRWTSKDKQVMETWAATLKGEGIASDVIFMSSMFVAGDKLKELRAAAAKHGADALLVINGAAQTDSYVNPASLFNLTVVGGYVVPGSHRDALFVMQGGLVDVGNGFLYASVESEGVGKIIRPTFIIEEKDAIDRAKQEAVANFGPELLRRVRNLRGACTPPTLPPLVITR